MTLLDVRRLSKEFGGLRALDGVSFASREGEILGIIGPNGAGKTTLFNLISGVYAPSAGEILFQGKSILRLKPHQVSRLALRGRFKLCVPFKTLMWRPMSWWPMGIVSIPSYGDLPGLSDNLTSSERSKHSSSGPDFSPILSTPLRVFRSASKNASKSLVPWHLDLISSSLTNLQPVCVLRSRPSSSNSFAIR